MALNFQPFPTPPSEDEKRQRDIQMLLQGLDTLGKGVSQYQTGQLARDKQATAAARQTTQDEFGRQKRTREEFAFKDQYGPVPGATSRPPAPGIPSQGPQTPPAASQPVYGGIDYFKPQAAPEQPTSLLKPPPPTGGQGAIAKSPPTAMLSDPSVRQPAWVQKREATTRKSALDQEKLKIQRGGLDIKGIQLNRQLEKDATAKQEAVERKAEGDRLRGEEAARALSTIDEALSKVNIASAGPGSLTKILPGSFAKNLESVLTTVESIVGLEKIGEMKAQSRTGATGFGQLSIRELDLLVAAKGSLKQAQSPGQLRKHLTAIRKHYSNWMALQRGEIPVGLVDDGYEFMGGEGGHQNKDNWKAVR